MTPRETKTQARRIFDKFGGELRLVSALQAIGKPRNKCSIYKWDYPRHKGGTGGLIPTRAWPDIFAAARHEGILITSEDMDPREL